MKKVIVLDYGIGNIGSIINMFDKLGVAAEYSADHEKIRQAECFILPGVGSYDKGVQCLHESGLIPLLTEQVIDLRKPLLGICLGMQLLVNSSEEGECSGLGWIPGACRKFISSDSFKVPHMGWNTVRSSQGGKLLANMNEARFYFVHSYHVECDRSYVSGVTNYINDFVSSICCGNIYGVQFHPEKSHRYGMRVLKNFLEIC